MALASVRPATLDDVEEIIRIQASTWRTAYAELIPRAAVDRLSGPAARQAWRAAVTAGAGHHVFVATEGNWTVGFCAAARAAEDFDQPDGVPLGQLATLLVEPRWGRRGHGKRLFDAAAEALRADGAPGGLVWVPEQDVASRAFYARQGWEADGMVRVLDAGDRELREIRLVGPLALAKVEPGRNIHSPSNGSSPIVNPG
ncbi:MAG: GNAT family N-acetyltransferase [Pseudonocardia sp.]|nr:GNAT family N-acetyltransferase [Pseudonocardia sp.]